jgi:CDP-diacylglycerol--glycerol-3-phosphate 3-phosphatidyltransferase
MQAKPSRRYSSSTASAITTSPAPQASMLGAFTNELDRIAPRFEIHGSQIEILRSPSEFYETMKVGTNCM